MLVQGVNRFINAGHLFLIFFRHFLRTKCRDIIRKIGHDFLHALSDVSVAAMRPETQTTPLDKSAVFRFPLLFLYIE
jgi:hypothetical protein